MKKKNLNLNNYDLSNIKKKEDFDPIKYQKKKNWKILPASRAIHLYFAGTAK